MESRFIDAFSHPVIGPGFEFDELATQRVDQCIATLGEHGIVITVGSQKANPIVKCAEAAAFGDLHFEDRLDHVARVSLLSEYAIDGDLDLHVRRSGLIRLEGETDIALRERHRIAQKGKSAAGPDDYYKSEALGVDATIRDVGVASQTILETKRRINIYLLTHDNGGIPDADLIASVSDRLNQKSFRPNTVFEVVVHPAIVAPVNVTAHLYLYPNTLVPADAGGALKAAFKTDQRLGFDLTDSYIKKHLQLPGVQKVVLTDWSDVNTDMTRALSLGDVIVTSEYLIS